MDRNKSGVAVIFYLIVFHFRTKKVRVWFCNRRQKEKRINPPQLNGNELSCLGGPNGGGSREVSPGDSDLEDEEFGFSDDLLLDEDDDDMEDETTDDESSKARLRSHLISHGALLQLQQQLQTTGSATNNSFTPGNQTPPMNIKQERKDCLPVTPSVGNNRQSNVSSMGFNMQGGGQHSKDMSTAAMEQ